jgi:hypothetical protein
MWIYDSALSTSMRSIQNQELHLTCFESMDIDNSTYLFSACAGELDGTIYMRWNLHEMEFVMNLQGHHTQLHNV